MAKLFTNRYIWLMFLQVEVHLQNHLNMVETRIGFSLVGLIEKKESLKKNEKQVVVFIHSLSICILILIGQN